MKIRNFDSWPVWLQISAPMLVIMLIVFMAKQLHDSQTPSFFNKLIHSWIINFVLGAIWGMIGVVIVNLKANRKIIYVIGIITTSVLFSLMLSLSSPDTISRLSALGYFLFGGLGEIISCELLLVGLKKLP